MHTLRKTYKMVGMSEEVLAVVCLWSIWKISWACNFAWVGPLLQLAVGNYRFSWELPNNPPTSEETEQKLFSFLEVFVNELHSIQPQPCLCLLILTPQPRSVLEIAAPTWSSKQCCSTLEKGLIVLRTNPEFALAAQMHYLLFLLHGPQCTS